MADMRAKFVCTDVEHFKDIDGNVTGERWKFSAVGPSHGYPTDGSDDDNTFARWSPSAGLEIYCVNPALFGKYQVGDKHYADFTKAV